jgi:hypothetical protein
MVPNDISTRWNSTYLMLIRAWRLRKAINGWLEKYGPADFQLRGLQLSLDDWNQIRYLIVILRPFFKWTEGLSKASTPIISKAWATYTSLFRHLETLESTLQRKQTAWKSQLAVAVTAAHRKLSEYYTRTDGHRGTIYNLACVLDPMRSLTSTRVQLSNPAMPKNTKMSFALFTMKTTPTLS